MFFQTDKNNDLIKVAALLIHAAKIDENYSDNEEQVIKELLVKIGAKKENIVDIIQESKKIEKDSNQILDFTKEVKNMNEEKKIIIIESLWKIVYSDKNADIYETGLMRRLSGLLYIDSKIMGDIKEKIKKENS